MQDSITVGTEPTVRYLLRLGDTCLIHAQRLGEWCGHAPIIEEDIALTNIALDLIGQARGILTRAGQLDGRQFDEDQLAFLRDERDYLNVTTVSPDPDAPDAVLIADLDGPPVRVYLCDPVEVLTPEAADLHQFLLIDARDRYADGGRSHQSQF